MTSARPQGSGGGDGGKGAPFAGIQVQITNELSVPLDIYDVFDPAGEGQTAPYLYTKLGTIPAGETVSVTTIREVAQLEAMYTGVIAELQGWYYQQFPVKLMSGTKLRFANQLPVHTVTASDWDAVIQSLLFHKFAMANPDSLLTKNFFTALKSGDPKVVNAFFAGTQNFKSCTLSSWNAVMTWLTMFTSAWQGPYYLYEKAPASPPQNYAPVLIGTLNIVSSAGDGSATLKLCTQDADGNLRAMNPPASSSVAMAGDGTMIDQNPGQDVSLTLTPVWMNTIQTTMEGNQPKTTYISGPVLTGTVASKQVVSMQTLMPPPGKSTSGVPGKSGSGSGSLSSSIYVQLFGILCQLAGLVFGAVMLYDIFSKRANRNAAAQENAKNEATSESDYEERVRTLDGELASETAEAFNENADTMASDAASVADGYREASNIEQRELLTETINNESNTLNEEINTQLEDGMTPTQEFETAVESAADAFDTAMQQVNDGNLSEASTTMSEAANSMQRTLDQSASQLQQSEMDALQNSADAVSNAAEQTDALSEAQEQYEENMDNEANDSGAPEEDTSPETEEIPEEIPGEMPAEI